MTKAIRATLAMLMAVAILATIVRGILPRIECNLEKGRINREVRVLERSGDQYFRSERAKKNILSCTRCLSIYPDDFQMYMLLGVNQRILGNYDDALESLRTALALAERPEIYMQMGEIEIARGNPAAARPLLLQAATFSVLTLDGIDEPMKSELKAEVAARRQRLLAARK